MILYGGADILAALAAGNSKYAIAAMYLEFQNIADGSGIVIPTFDRSGGIDYYNGLSGTIDYLRVPLILPPSLSTTDPSSYQGNRVVFFGMSDGVVGVHGLAFSDVALSKVYGAALAATPVPADPAQDIVFARTYTGISIIPKGTGFGVGVRMPLQFN